MKDIWFYANSSAVAACFLVMGIKEGVAGDSLGLDMYEAQRDGREIPQIDVALPLGLEKLQEFINHMTSFQPSDRPSTLDVTSRLLAINLKVTISC